MIVDMARAEIRARSRYRSWEKAWLARVAPKQRSLEADMPLTTILQFLAMSESERDTWVRTWYGL